MRKNLFSRSQKSHGFVASQTGPSGNDPFTLFENWFPSAIEEIGLYKTLKDSVPIISAAIGKLVRLTGGFRMQCSDEAYQSVLDNFVKNIDVNGTGTGLDRFIAVYFESLLTYGTAVGEAVLNKNGKVIQLYNTPVNNIRLRRNPANPTKVQLCRFNGVDITPVKYENFTVVSTLNPEAGQLYGTSILKGLPFIASVLMKIYTSIGQNWSRAGNLRYAVTYRPQNDALERNLAKERAMQIATEWSNAMSSKTAKDFIAVGDVDIKVIGADSQVLDSQVPVRQMLEQIVSKTGLPPFMLGLSWSSTERMSSQQADVLTSELWAYRRILSPVAEKLCNLYLSLEGCPASATIVWDDITLQDEREEAQARLYNAQAQQLEGRKEGAHSE
jgi:hypothetical protein